MLEELRKIKRAKIIEQILKIERTPEIIRLYSWFERNITKKREYLAYTEELERKKQEKKEKLDELYKIKEKYESAKTIQQLGYDLKSAIKTLKGYGIRPILTENEMKECTYRRTKAYIDSMEGIILVHKTNYVPNQGQIKSVKDSKVFREGTIEIAGHIIPIKIQDGRDTVHFAANGEVKEHFEGGEWDKCKYAVLIPFVDIPKEQYAKVYPNDTYTNGSVILTPDSYILVPKGEGELVSKNNPNVNVIEYEGPTVTGYAEKLVGMLGYSNQQIDPGPRVGWRDETAKKSFINWAIYEGFSIGIHHGSKEQYQEVFFERIQVIIQLIKYVEIHPEVLNNPQFVSELSEIIEANLKKINCSFYLGYETLCQDLYTHLMEVGYEIPKKLIFEISKEDGELTVKARLRKEIIKIIKEHNSLTTSETKAIKK